MYKFVPVLEKAECCTRWKEALKELWAEISLALVEGLGLAMHWSNFALFLTMVVMVGLWAPFKLGSLDKLIEGAG